MVVCPGTTSHVYMPKRGKKNPKKTEKNEAIEDSEVENVGEREDDEGLSNAVPAAYVKHTDVNIPCVTTPTRRKCVGHCSNDTILAMSMPTVCSHISRTNTPAFPPPHLRVCAFCIFCDSTRVFTHSFAVAPCQFSGP